MGFKEQVLVRPPRVAVITSWAMMLGGALVLSGCAAQPKEPQPTIKQAVETAPADLQLSCASQAQRQFGSSGGILPLSSALARSDVFRVELTSQSGNFTCEIDRAGTIISILPVAAPVATESAVVSPEAAATPAS